MIDQLERKFGSDFVRGFMDELEKDADLKSRVLGWIGKQPPTQPSPISPLQSALAKRREVSTRLEGVKPVITRPAPMRGPSEDFPLFGESGRRDLKALVRKRALSASGSSS